MKSNKLFIFTHAFRKNLKLTSAAGQLRIDESIALRRTRFCRLGQLGERTIQIHSEFSSKVERQGRMICNLAMSLYIGRWRSFRI